jgi:hypothetical protein
MKHHTTNCNACDALAHVSRDGLCQTCETELDAYVTAREAEEREDYMRDMEMTADNLCR